MNQNEQKAYPRLTWKKTMLKDSSDLKQNEICSNTPFSYFSSEMCTHFEVLFTVQKYCIRETSCEEKVNIKQ